MLGRCIGTIGGAAAASTARKNELSLPVTSHHRLTILRPIFLRPIFLRPIILRLIFLRLIILRPIILRPITLR
jgi:hypothetical protein